MSAPVAPAESTMESSEPPLTPLLLLRQATPLLLLRQTTPLLLLGGTRERAEALGFSKASFMHTAPEDLLKF